MIHAPGKNCLEAWKCASRALLANSGGVAQNVIVEIERPTYIRQDWVTRFDPRRLVHDADSVRDVANTIFPTKTLQNARRRGEDFYDRYARTYQQGRARKPSAWGTYFRRMTAFDGGRKPINQLQRAISVLRGWGKRSRASLVFHLSGPHLDAPRPLGAPCLQYMQVLNKGADGLDLVVAYRSHDYFQKAL